MTHRTFQQVLLRLFIVGCCVAAAADVHVRVGGRERLPIAIMDISRSMGTDIPSLPEGLRVDSRWIVVADGAREVVGGTEAPRLSRSATRLGEGLRRAASSHPGSDVIVITDGRATDGDARAGARAIRASGGRVYVLPPPVPAADVGLIEARVSSEDQRLRVTAIVGASTSGRVVVSLVRGDDVLDRTSVAVVPDMRRSIVLRDAQPPREGASYQVTLTPAPGTPDDDPDNNRLTLGWRSVVRSVLLVGIDDPDQLGLHPNLHVTTATRLDGDALAAVDLVVLADVPWSRIAAGMDGLARLVRSGGRLLLLGGPSAYRPGGWTGTPLERELSPLRSDPDDGDQLAALLLLDRSGSTAERALPYLKAAARSATLRLVPGERLGVLPFAATPAERLVAPGFVAAGDRPARERLLGALEEMGASGRTDIPAAIQRGIDVLQGGEAEQRWLVLLTDGDPDGSLQAQDMAPLRAALDEHGVELAALVVGDSEAAAAIRAGLAQRPTDVMVLEDADEFSTRLAELVRRRRLRQDELPAPTELEVVGRFGPPLDVTRLAPRRLHDLKLADGASVYARARWSDGPRASAPFMARRDVGSGVVWGLAWGPSFAPGLEARRVAYEQLRLAISGLAAESDRGLRADRVGSDLVVRLPVLAGSGSVTVVAQSAEGERLEQVLVEQAPGLFRGPLPEAPPGALALKDKAGILRPLMLPQRPPPEHRGSGVDAAALADLAAVGGGRRLRPGEAAPGGGRPAPLRLAPWLLLLAGILLVLERLRSRADSGGMEPTSGDR